MSAREFDVVERAVQAQPSHERTFQESIVAEEVGRIESLGLNCELGFVLHALGNNVPALFRWTFTPPEAVVQLIEADFSGLYDGHAMIPSGPDILLDKNYNVQFHSNIKTEFCDGAWRCVDPDEDKRERILAAEKNLILGQVALFRKRFEMPNTLYVLTRHAIFPHQPAEGIAAVIKARSGNTPFALLEVNQTPDPAMVGRAERVGDVLHRGYVSHFAPLASANDVNIEDWTRLLKNALDRTKAGTA